MNRLQKYKTNNYPEFDNEILSPMEYLIKDNGYLEFLNAGYSGLYFSKSLHLYGQSSDLNHDINYINKVFKQEFDFRKENLFCFGCDLFGNQFCFRQAEIVFFNIETGQFEFLAKTFKEWITVLLSDYNYFTGEQILQDWETLMLPLKPNERLVPITPFIIGGEYSPNNMKTLDLFKTLKYNAEIAKQIKDLPDGTELQLVTKSPDAY